MSSILPIVYLLILFICLVVLLLFLSKQILKKKELEKELSELQKKLRSGIATPKDYYSIGVIYLSKKLFDEAILQFSKALKNWDKEDIEGLSNLYNTIGFTYFESEQFDVSIYYYKEAIALRPNYIVALNNLAYAYEKKKMLQDAIEVYSKVLILDEENETANEKLIILNGRSKIRDDRI
jgi:tetratricopeptide (TPR) repeat protein